MGVIEPFSAFYDQWRERLSTALLVRPTEQAIKRIDDREFFDADQLPWVKTLEGHWQEIREELEGLLVRPNDVPSFHEVSPHQRGITSDDGWKTHIFYIHGHRCDENCARCPRTTERLATIPGLKSAMFSILSPRKHIPSHRGPYAGLLRYHLGLVVPEDAPRCRIRVGTSIRHWEAGRSLIFDDSHEHEVWNDTDQMRAVLFVDFIRPLPRVLSACNRLAVRSLGWASMARIAARNASRLSHGH